MKKLFGPKDQLKNKNVSADSIPAEDIVLHHSCQTLYLTSFIKAYCNHDYSGLIISGTPSRDQLLSAWTEILIDYGTLIKSEDHEAVLLRQKEISQLRWHISYVDNAVYILWQRFEPEIIAELTTLGYEITAEFGSDEYKEQLNKTISLCKRQVFDLESLEEEYERLQKTTQGKNQSEESFFKTIAMLSKFQGYHLDKNVLTVADFVSIYNNYVEELDLQNKQLQD
jgi:hypothetical protein